MSALGQKRTLVLIRSPRWRARAVYPVHDLVTKNRTSCRVVAVPAPAMKPSKKLQRRFWFFDRWIKRWASFRVASIPSHSLRVRVISSAAIRSVRDRWITATASFRVASISSAAIDRVLVGHDRSVIVAHAADSLRGLKPLIAAPMSPL